MLNQIKYRIYSKASDSTFGECFSYEEAVELVDTHHYFDNELGIVDTYFIVAYK